MRSSRAVRHESPRQVDGAAIRDLEHAHAGLRASQPRRQPLHDSLLCLFWAGVFDEKPRYLRMRRFSPATGALGAGWSRTPGEMPSIVGRKIEAWDQPLWIHRSRRAIHRGPDDVAPLTHHEGKHQNPWGQTSRDRRPAGRSKRATPRAPFATFRPSMSVSPFNPNRGRDAGYPAPPAQIRAGALTHTAPASGQTSAALSATCRLARLRGPQAACVTRTRHSVRYVLWPVDLPLAPVLRSIDSAGTLIPLFADFTATMTESDSSSPFVSGYDSSVFPSRPRH